MFMNCQVEKAESKVNLIKVPRYLFATNSLHWETTGRMANTHSIYVLHERDQNLKKDYQCKRSMNGKKMHFSLVSVVTAIKWSLYWGAGPRTEVFLGCLVSCCFFPGSWHTQYKCKRTQFSLISLQPILILCLHNWWIISNSFTSLMFNHFGAK